MMEENEEVTNSALLALIGLVVGLALGLILAWLYLVQRRVRPEPSSSTVAEEERITLESEPAAPEKERSAAPKLEPELEPDDLTRVEGIGPKMSSLLEEVGIVTFGQLARSDPAALRQILRDEGLQFADPTTWPEQAALAADGAWEELDALQQELSGGRRVG